jgi:hypothetical protein
MPRNYAAKLRGKKAQSFQRPNFAAKLLNYGRWKSAMGESRQSGFGRDAQKLDIQLAARSGRKETGNYRVVSPD